MAGLNFNLPVAMANVKIDAPKLPDYGAELEKAVKNLVALNRAQNAAARGGGGGSTNGIPSKYVGYGEVYDPWQKKYVPTQVIGIGDKAKNANLERQQNELLREYARQKVASSALGGLDKLDVTRQNAAVNDVRKQLAAEGMAEMPADLQKTYGAQVSANLAPIQQGVDERAKAVDDVSTFDYAWDKLKAGANRLWGQVQTPFQSDEERARQAVEDARYEQELRAQNPALEDEYRRRSAGDGFLDRRTTYSGGGKTTSHFWQNSLGAAMDFLPEVAGAVGEMGVGNVAGGIAGGLAGGFLGGPGGAAWGARVGSTLGGSLGGAVGGSSSNVYYLARQIADAHPDWTEDQIAQAIAEGNGAAAAVGAATGAFLMQGRNVARIANGLRPGGIGVTRALQRGAAQDAARTSYMSRLWPAVRDSAFEGAALTGVNQLGINSAYNQATGEDQPMFRGVGDAIMGGGLAGAMFGPLRALGRPQPPASRVSGELVPDPLALPPGGYRPDGNVPAVRPDNPLAPNGGLGTPFDWDYSATPMGRDVGFGTAEVKRGEALGQTTPVAELGATTPTQAENVMARNVARNAERQAGVDAALQQNAAVTPEGRIAQPTIVAGKRPEMSMQSKLAIVDGEIDNILKGGGDSQYAMEAAIRAHELGVPFKDFFNRVVERVLQNPDVTQTSSPEVFALLKKLYESEGKLGALAQHPERLDQLNAALREIENIIDTQVGDDVAAERVRSVINKAIIDSGLTPEDMGKVVNLLRTAKEPKASELDSDVITALRKGINFKLSDTKRVNGILDRAAQLGSEFAEGEVGLGEAMNRLQTLAYRRSSAMDQFNRDNLDVNMRTFDENPFTPVPTAQRVSTPYDAAMTEALRDNTMRDFENSQYDGGRNAVSFPDTSDRISNEFLRDTGLWQWEMVPLAESPARFSTPHDNAMWGFLNDEGMWNSDDMQLFRNKPAEEMQKIGEDFLSDRDMYNMERVHSAAEAAALEANMRAAEAAEREAYQVVPKEEIDRIRGISDEVLADSFGKLQQFTENIRGAKLGDTTFKERLLAQKLGTDVQDRAPASNRTNNRSNSRVATAKSGVVEPVTPADVAEAFGNTATVEKRGNGQSPQPDNNPLAQATRVNEGKGTVPARRTQGRRGTGATAAGGTTETKGTGNAPAPRGGQQGATGDAAALVQSAVASLADGWQSNVNNLTSQLQNIVGVMNNLVNALQQGTAVTSVANVQPAKPAKPAARGKAPAPAPAPAPVKELSQRGMNSILNKYAHGSTSERIIADFLLSGKADVPTLYQAAQNLASNGATYEVGNALLDRMVRFDEMSSYLADSYNNSVRLKDVFNHIVKTEPEFSKSVDALRSIVMMAQNKLGGPTTDSNSYFAPVIGMQNMHVAANPPTKERITASRVARQAVKSEEQTNGLAVQNKVSTVEKPKKDAKAKKAETIAVNKEIVSAKKEEKAAAETKVKATAKKNVAEKKVAKAKEGTPAKFKATKELQAAEDAERKAKDELAKAQTKVRKAKDKKENIDKPVESKVADKPTENSTGTVAEKTLVDYTNAKEFSKHDWFNALDMDGRQTAQKRMKAIGMNDNDALSITTEYILARNKKMMNADEPLTPGEYKEFIERIVSKYRADGKMNAYEVALKAYSDIFGHKRPITKAVRYADISRLIDTMQAGSDRWVKVIGGRIEKARNESVKKWEDVAERPKLNETRVRKLDPKEAITNKTLITKRLTDWGDNAEDVRNVSPKSIRKDIRELVANGVKMEDIKKTYLSDEAFNDMGFSAGQRQRIGNAYTDVLKVLEKYPDDVNAALNVLRGIEEIEPLRQVAEQAKLGKLDAPPGARTELWREGAKPQLQDSILSIIDVSKQQGMNSETLVNSAIKAGWDYASLAALANQFVRNADPDVRKVGGKLGEGVLRIIDSAKRNEDAAADIGNAVCIR